MDDDGIPMMEGTELPQAVLDPLSLQDMSKVIVENNHHGVNIHNIANLRQPEVDLENTDCGTVPATSNTVDKIVPLVAEDDIEAKLGTSTNTDTTKSYCSDTLLGEVVLQEDNLSDDVIESMNYLVEAVCKLESHVSKEVKETVNHLVDMVCHPGTPVLSGALTDQLLKQESPGAEEQIKVAKPAGAKKSWRRSTLPAKKTDAPVSEWKSQVDDYGNKKYLRLNDCLSNDIIKSECCECAEGRAKLTGSKITQGHFHCSATNCIFTTTHWRSIIRHDATIHNKIRPGLRVFKCPLCSYVVIHISEYFRHMVHHQSNKSINEEEAAFLLSEVNKCKKIGLNYKRPIPKLLLESIKQIKRNDPKYKMKTIKTAASKKLTLAAKKYFLNPKPKRRTDDPARFKITRRGVCQKKIKLSKKLAGTPNRHEDGKFHCQECEFATEITQSIRRHYAAVHKLALDGTMYICDLCNLATTSKYDFYRHTQSLRHKTEVTKVEEQSNRKSKGERPDFNVDAVAPAIHLEKLKSTAKIPTNVKKEVKDVQKKVNNPTVIKTQKRTKKPVSVAKKVVKSKQQARGMKRKRSAGDSSPEPGEIIITPDTCNPLCANKSDKIGKKKRKQQHEEKVGFSANQTVNVKKKIKLTNNGYKRKQNHVNSEMSNNVQISKERKVQAKRETNVPTTTTDCERTWTKQDSTNSAMSNNVKSRKKRKVHQTQAKRETNIPTTATTARTTTTTDSEKTRTKITGSQNRSFGPKKIEKKVEIVQVEPAIQPCPEPNVLVDLSKSENPTDKGQKHGKSSQFDSITKRLVISAKADCDSSEDTVPDPEEIKSFFKSKSPSSSPSKPPATASPTKSKYLKILKIKQSPGDKLELVEKVGEKKEEEKQTNSVSKKGNLTHWKRGWQSKNVKRSLLQGADKSQNNPSQCTDRVVEEESYINSRGKQKKKPRDSLGGKNDLETCTIQIDEDNDLIVKILTPIKKSPKKAATPRKLPLQVAKKSTTGRRMPKKNVEIHRTHLQDSTKPLTGSLLSPKTGQENEVAKNGLLLGLANTPLSNNILLNNSRAQQKSVQQPQQNDTKLPSNVDHSQSLISNFRVALTRDANVTRTRQSTRQFDDKSYSLLNEESQYTADIQIKKKGKKTARKSTSPAKKVSVARKSTTQVTQYKANIQVKEMDQKSARKIKTTKRLSVAKKSTTQGKKLPRQNRPQLPTRIDNSQESSETTEGFGLFEEIEHVTYEDKPHRGVTIDKNQSSYLPESHRTSHTSIVFVSRETPSDTECDLDIEGSDEEDHLTHSASGFNKSKELSFPTQTPAIRKEQKITTIQTSHEQTYANVASDSAARKVKPAQIAKKSTSKSPIQKKISVVADAVFLKPSFTDSDVILIDGGREEPSDRGVISARVDRNSLSSAELWQELVRRGALTECACGETHLDKTRYYLHRTVHPPENILKCAFCNYIAADLYSLHVHIVDHAK